MNEHVSLDRRGELWVLHKRYAFLIARTETRDGAAEGFEHVHFGLINTMRSEPDEPDRSMWADSYHIDEAGLTLSGVKYRVPSWVQVK